MAALVRLAFKPGGDVEDTGHVADFDGVSVSWIAVSFGQDAEPELSSSIRIPKTSPSWSIGWIIFCKLRGDPGLKID